MFPGTNAASARAREERSCQKSAARRRGHYPTVDNRQGRCSMGKSLFAIFREEQKKYGLGQGLPGTPWPGPGGASSA